MNYLEQRLRECADHCNQEFLEPTLMREAADTLAAVYARISRYEAFVREAIRLDAGANPRLSSLAALAEEKK